MNATEAMGVTAGITVGELGRRGLPTAVPGIDIRKLPIGPTEAFVLSRLDGHSGVHEISLTTGLSSEQVTAALQLLVKLGAALWTGAPAAPAESQSPPAQVVSERRKESEGQAAPNLSHAQRERIQTLADGGARKDFYELLGVPRSAERAQIKDAYFALVAEIHPDRFFGKDLGELKPTLEALFKRLTEAHDTLTRSRRRVEYDAGLPAQVHPAESPPPIPVPRSAPTVHVVPEPAAPTSSPRSLPRASVPPVSFRNTLRSPAERYVQAAAGAQREGNALSALNSLRIAASILPNDEALRARVSDLEIDLDRQQADKLLADARQAEDNGDASQALRLYGRIVKATQSPAHYRRAAEYALTTGHHQQAADFARKALVSDGNNVQFHILLGRAYLEAEMLTSARREFERASELAPSDPNVKDWLKRIKRGDV